MTKLLLKLASWILLGSMTTLVCVLRQIVDQKRLLTKFWLKECSWRSRSLQTELRAQRRLPSVWESWITLTLIKTSRGLSDSESAIEEFLNSKSRHFFILEHSNEPTCFSFSSWMSLLTRPLGSFGRLSLRENSMSEPTVLSWDSRTQTWPRTKVWVPRRQEAEKLPSAFTLSTSLLM